MSEQKPVVKTVVRLDYEQYKLLEAKVGRIGLDHGTSALEAGYQLGVQAVLKALRDGYVIGTPR